MLRARLLVSKCEEFSLSRINMIHENKAKFFHFYMREKNSKVNHLILWSIWSGCYDSKWLCKTEYEDFTIECFSAWHGTTYPSTFIRLHWRWFERLQLFQNERQLFKFRKYHDNVRIPSWDLYPSLLMLFTHIFSDERRKKSRWDHTKKSKLLHHFILNR